MTSGLRWPWCGILSRRENRGRMTCKSSFVSSWGYYTNVPTTHRLLWSWRERLHANTHTIHTQTRSRAHVGMQERRLVAGENFICVFPTWRPCELLNWAGPLDLCFGVHTENLLPVRHFTTHTCTSTSFFCMFLQLEQMGLFAVCLSSFLVVWNRETLTCLSPSQIRQRIFKARSHYWNA